MIQDLLMSLNWGAVAVAAVAFFLLGAIWYNVFGKQWMAAVGKTEAELRSGPKTAFLLTFLIEGVMVIVMAGLIHMIGLMSVAGAIKFGLFTGLAFSGGTIAINNMYAVRPLSLTVLDTAHMTLGFIVASLILTLWK